jgi:hypothetical protein
MTKLPWYRRYAWVIFLIMSLLVLIIGTSGESGLTGADAPFGAMAAGDTTDVGLETQLRGTFALGMSIFGLFIAIFAFRRGDQWAWYAMWTWPLFFILHIIAFDTWIPDGVFLGLCLLALALTPPSLLRSARSNQNTLSD